MAPLLGWCGLGVNLHKWTDLVSRVEHYLGIRQDKSLLQALPHITFTNAYYVTNKWVLTLGITDFAFFGHFHWVYPYPAAPVPKPTFTLPTFSCVYCSVLWTLHLGVVLQQPSNYLCPILSNPVLIISWEKGRIVTLPSGM
jgi:hypothetical protein